MADTVDLGILVPHTFDVIVDDFQKVMSTTHHQQIRLSPRVEMGVSPVAYQFELRTSTGDNSTGDTSEHEIQRTTTEMLIAAEISRRWSHFVYETTAVAANSVTNFSSGNFVFEGERLTPKRSYIESLFDLSNPGPSDIPFLCQMEVSEIALSSPLRVRLTVRNLIVVIHMTVTPPTVPIVVPVAAPAATTLTAKISIAISAGSLIISSIPAGIAIKSQIEARNKTQLEERYVQNLRRELRNGNCRTIQTYLKLLGYYRGRIDNRFERESKNAAASFAESMNLGLNISYEDPTFLRELVRRMLELNPEFRSL